MVKIVISIHWNERLFSARSIQHFTGIIQMAAVQLFCVVHGSFFYPSLIHCHCHFVARFVNVSVFFGIEMDTILTFIIYQGTP